jgi:N-formylglutamate deformylase
MQLFNYIPPKKWHLPILISVPHAGQFIPHDIRSDIHSQYIDPTQDCDFFVDHLYHFANELGVGLIKANYSRYVVDLNRDLKPLYNDGRIITSMIPETTFLDEGLYDEVLKESEKERRITLYYKPYHEALSTILNSIKQDFGVACLLDAHSIKRNVPSIHSVSFPDLILGTNNSMTCPQKVEEIAIEVLSNASYRLQVNTPFRGGAITRNFANVAAHIYTLQLEMSQDLYMNENDNTRNATLEAQLSAHLRTYVRCVGEAVLNELGDLS